MDHHTCDIDLINRISHTLIAGRPASSALNEAALRDLATQLVQTWQRYGNAPEADAPQALGAAFARHAVRLPTLMRAGRLLAADALPADEWITNGETPLIYRYWDCLLEGFIEGTTQIAQHATIAQMHATQQREDQLRAVIQELSTPIIPIYRGVLVLPLVGALDSLRAQEITERLLEEIVRQQADIVIIDITGVPVVDTSVANHLMMTARAVTLLGSRVIFTGISSTVAQTIVQLGINLGDVTTLSNLQAGMLYALEQLGLGITPLETA